MRRPKFYNMYYENFMHIPSFVLTATSRKKTALMFKAMLDYTVAVISLVILFPFFVIVALAIKLASPEGPVFFKQIRCGLNGRLFSMYKFRTMAPDAELRRGELAGLNEADGPAFKIKRDPRIIPFVGHLLRRTSLDELPQLINIMRGEMSVVGARPPIPEEVSRYEIWERRRLSMKPGLTCLWQIAPNRNSISFEEWMKMDLAYIDNWSLWLDLKIVVKTFRVLLAGYGM